jgi:hypothetical protein
MIPTDMGAGGLPHGTLSVKSSGAIVTPLSTSTYDDRKSWIVLESISNLADNTTMQTKIVCAVCGEETGGNPTYSLYGSVHKWGPTDHKFEPKEIAIEEEKQ